MEKRFIDNLISKQTAQTGVIKKEDTTVTFEKDLLENTINDKHLSVYFDFNKPVAIEDSKSAIDLILSYLRNDPRCVLEIYGYSDDANVAGYNSNLSEIRAMNVKAILEEAGIEPSRLFVNPRGADASMTQDSEEAGSAVFTIR